MHKGGIMAKIMVGVKEEDRINKDEIINLISRRLKRSKYTILAINYMSGVITFCRKETD